MEHSSSYPVTQQLLQYWAAAAGPGWSKHVLCVLGWSRAAAVQHLKGRWQWRVGVAGWGRGKRGAGAVVVLTGVRPELEPQQSLALALSCTWIQVGGLPLCKIGKKPCPCTQVNYLCSLNWVSYYLLPVVICCISMAWELSSDNTANQFKLWKYVGMKGIMYVESII